MAELKKNAGQVGIDYMARDFDSFLTSMHDLIPSKVPEWEEFESQADFGNVLLQLFAHMGDILSYYQDRIANESFLTTAQTRRSIAHHLRLIGYKLSTAQPASTSLTLSFPADCDEVVIVNQGDAFATKSQKDKSSVRFEYTGELPITIDCNALHPIQDPNDETQEKRFFVGVPVEEGRLIENEILGDSTGIANQRFPLPHSGLILRSLGIGQEVNKDIILLVEQGETIEEWRLQESLAFSRDSQKDFAIEIDENDRATILFGDGDFGAIPAVGATMTATYRIGGGEHGNVVADSITTIVDAPQLTLASADVTNFDPATGGADRETIEHAVKNAPAVFRSLKRAVTTADYEALALNFNGVGKVRAESGNFNTVNLFVAPAGGGNVSDVLEANLLAYFEDKRPASTIVEIRDVDYVPVYVTAEIGVESYYSEEEIRGKVKEAGRDLLAFDNVDFAKTIYLSKFFEAIEAIEGVKFVNIAEFWRDGKLPNNGQPPEDFESSGKLLFESNEIPKIPDEPDYLDGIRVLLQGEF